MKLRNKKTGDAVYVDFQIPLCNNDEILGSYSVTSLEELNRSFEDYKPTEPLIKDKKIRKAVRAWAEANNITQVSYDACWNAFRYTDFVVAFDYDFDRHDGFEDMKSYTIDELCGDEK